jgi:hypothetical protein
MLLNEERYGIQPEVPIALLGPDVALILCQEIPDRYPSLFESRHHPLGFCSRYPWIILPLNNHERFLDLLNIIYRRDSLQECSVFWIALVSVLLAL